MNVLVVANDFELKVALRLMLQSESMVVTETDDGEEAVALTELYSCSAVILDVDFMPDQSGLGVVRALRACKSDVPILLLSRVGEVAAKVKALCAGADDYLVKPFHRDEFIARLGAIVRRSVGISESRLVFGEFVLDLDAKVAMAGGKRVPLTGKEYSLLEHMVHRRGRVCTKENLLNALYGGGLDEPELKIIDVFICKVRKKLAALLPDVVFLETIWGRGYVFNGGVKRAPGTGREMHAKEIEHAVA